MKKLIVLFLMIFAFPSMAVADNVLSDSDFVGKCGTYHVLTAVFVQVVTCSAGTYLPANATSCSTCPSGYYCAGGTFDVGSTDQGKVLDQYTCSAGYFLPAATRGCVACPSGFTCSGGTFGYNATNSQGLDYTSSYYTADLPNACAANMPHVMVAVFGRECAAGYYLPKKSSTCSACPSGYSCPGGVYEESSTTDQGLEISAVEQTCSAGYYLPANGEECAICPVDNYCAGGTYTPDESAHGITACTTGLFAPQGSSVVAQCGRKLRIGNDTVYLRSAKKTATALNVDINQDGTADFFGNMTTTPTYINSSSTQYVRIQWGNNDYYLCDDTTCP